MSPLDTLPPAGPGAWCRPLVVLALSTSGLLLGGCEGLTGPKEEHAGLSIGQTAVQLDIGESTLLTAVTSSASAGLPGFEWTSSDPGVLAVDPQGRVMGVGPGVAHVRVHLGGRMDSATVRVGGVDGGTFPEWRSVHAGDRFTCALDVSGERYCWGENPFGAHGNGTRRLHTATHSPVAAGDPLRYRILSGGNFHACGITLDGAGYCWGNNAGSASDYELVPRRLTVPRALAEISSGLSHACAVDVQGNRYCWGSNLMGALGMPNAGTRQATPMRADEAVRFERVSAGMAHSCGVSGAGEAFCWGTAQVGELGEGSLAATRLLPHPVSGDLRFTSISAGNAGTCALTAEGSAYCWGIVTFTDGDSPRRGASAVPTRIEADARFAQVVVGAGHACGRSAEGMVYCWGLNESGQAGTDVALGQSCASPYVTGSVPCVALPRLVSPALRFRQISAGRLHTCGVTMDAAMYCWGDNNAGQLGSGRVRAYSAQPVRVAAVLR